MQTIENTRKYYTETSASLVSKGLVTKELFYSLIEARVAALEATPTNIKAAIDTAAAQIQESSKFVESIGKDFGLKERSETGFGDASGEEHCCDDDRSFEQAVSFLVNQKGFDSVEAMEKLFSLKYGEYVCWFGRYLSCYLYKVRPALS